MEIGPVVIKTILAQADLITTLGVAVIGGIIVLCIQLGFHNNDEQKTPISLTWFGLVPLALVSESISVFFGYLTHGAVTDLIPVLISTSYSTNEILADQKIEGMIALRSVMIAQFIFFGAGILSIIVLLLLNLKLIRR